MTIKQETVIAAIKSDIVSTLQYLDFKLKYLVNESVSQNDGYFYQQLEKDGEGVNGLFENLAQSGEIIDSAYNDDIESAHSYLMELGVITNETGIFERLDLSKKHVYNKSVQSSFKHFLNVLQDELKDHVIDEEGHEREGELPEDFDYTSVFDKVFEEYDVIDINDFDTEN
ncbi:hypothetical protein [Alteromonas macleodii]|uniref:hypothetical protein n=1 Tax=Alteromonas macleodii TaxID=28108 RepID=UPI003140B814|tara:strand:+ start:3139 stop:3651 length:513 start_codon:yes stop_codon:yes gene_type:complete